MTISYEPAVDDAPVQEVKKARKRKQAEPEQPQSEPLVEPAPDAQPGTDGTPAQETPSPEPASKTRARKGNSKKAAPASEESNMLLGELAQRYLQHLESEGKSHGTLFSYGMELKLACKELHEGTMIAMLTQGDVLRFFNCARVMLLRDGKPKAKPSIDKSRRVLRLALVWAAEQGWIESAPIPEAVTNA